MLPSLVCSFTNKPCSCNSLRFLSSWTEGPAFRIQSVAIVNFPVRFRQKELTIKLIVICSLSNKAVLSMMLFRSFRALCRSLPKTKPHCILSATENSKFCDHLNHFLIKMAEAYTDDKSTCCQQQNSTNSCTRTFLTFTTYLVLLGSFSSDDIFLPLSVPAICLYKL